MGGPIDIEIMMGCEGRSIQCLEVNPALIGSYREAGQKKKWSDIDNTASEEQVERVNQMGDRSAKSLLADFFDSHVEAVEVVQRLTLGWSCFGIGSFEHATPRMRLQIQILYITPSSVCS